MSKRRGDSLLYRILVALAIQALLLSAAPLNASEEDDPADDIQWSVFAKLAPRSLLLDAAVVGHRMVAVGERGHILISEDDGENWRQARVPTRATLTGVYFHDEDHGWAVGHDAVIVRTSDGGETWERVHFAPEEERPLLDVWFADQQRGVAVGAYGYYLETNDGGDSWEDRLFEAVDQGADEGQDEDQDEGVEITSGAELMEYLEDEDPISDLHLNELRAADDGTLYIAAEAGHFFRSDDSGDTWQNLVTPYEGSYYGLVPLGGERLLLFGLRGNLFYSDDRGENWEGVDAGTDAILMGGGMLRDGRPVIGGLGGTLLVAKGAEAEAAPQFVLVQQEDRKAIATILENPASDLILIGEDGVKKLGRTDFDLGDSGN